MWCCVILFSSEFYRFWFAYVMFDAEMPVFRIFFSVCPVQKNSNYINFQEILNHFRKVQQQWLASLSVVLMDHYRWSVDCKWPITNLGDSKRLDLRFFFPLCNMVYKGEQQKHDLIFFSCHAIKSLLSNGTVQLFMWFINLFTIMLIDGLRSVHTTPQ